MAPSKLFLDANILIEILESRPKHKKAEKLLLSGAGNLHISTLTCHIAAYVSRKRIGLEVLEQFLGDYIWLELKPEDIAWAFDNRRDNDFEDALQIAMAVRSGCSVFYTLDKQLVNAYATLPTLEVKLLK
ncbi:MAG: PIN domain-containing protein [Candidatus Saccharibacteria bacterium]|nr:PIN domain-containing protein [Candidatus Saccharibacteria bacterium]